MIRRFLSISALLLSAAILAACGGVSSDESQPIVTEPDEGKFTALFNPTAAQVPFPNDIFFSGTTDGTLNIPASSANPGLTAMNFLDGYSTTASIYVDTTDTINAATLQYGATVFLINTNTFAVVPATVGRADYSNGTSVIEIVPAAPLDAATTYAGFVTTNVESSTGDNLETDETFQLMLNLYAAGRMPGDPSTGDETVDALYEALYPLFQLADGATIGAQSLAVAWSFKTQSIGASLDAIEGSATAQDSGFAPIPKNGVDYTDGVATTEDMNPQLAGKADVYVGIIEVPYFHDAANPLSGYWVPESTICESVVAAVDALSEQPESTTSACPMPAVNTMLRVPVLLTVPNTSSATGGAIAGVAIFEHGITRNRTDMLAIADAMADAGRAVITIDIALHGLTDTSSPLFASEENPLYQGAAQASGDATLVEGLTEATFNLDLDGEAGIDDSGTHFINLSSLLTTRDNLRQTAANLVYLTKTIPTMDYNAALDGGASGADFDGLPIGFVGQSLGGITGTTFLATNSDVGPGLLSVPGGVLTQLLTNSNTFAPVINAGLAENGVIEGTRFYEEFLRNAQSVVDGGDPINYAAGANANHAVVMHEVIGGSGSEPDQVVPNSATEALAAAMGLPARGPSGSPYADAGGVDGLVRFLAGDHGSLLDPSASPNVTAEMQTQMANFIGSNGQSLPVGSVDPTVVDEP